MTFAEERAEMVKLQGGSFVVPPPLDLVTFAPNAGKIARAEDALAERVARVRERGVAVEARIVPGVPHQAIALRADEIDAELIVVGSHGAGALLHAVIGS